VMLGCSFGLVSDGVLPEGVSEAIAWVFHTGVSVTISLLTISLWCAFIVTRRLNQYTAWVLMNREHHERELVGKAVFSMSEQMNATAIRRAFDNWFKLHCEFLGKKSEQALCWGVLCLFVASWALFFARMENTHVGTSSTYVFVGCATPTALLVLFLERREAQHQRMKLPGTVYEKPAPRRSKSQ
jgi:hypothetical protein